MSLVLSNKFSIFFCNQKRYVLHVWWIRFFEAFSILHTCKNVFKSIICINIKKLVTGITNLVIGVTVKSHWSNQAKNWYFVLKWVYNLKTKADITVVYFLENYTDGEFDFYLSNSMSITLFRLCVSNSFSNSSQNVIEHLLFITEHYYFWLYQ